MGQHGRLQDFLSIPANNLATEGYRGNKYIFFSLLLEKFNNRNGHMRPLVKTRPLPQRKVVYF